MKRKSIFFVVTWMMLFSMITPTSNFGCVCAKSDVTITYDANGGDVSTSFVTTPFRSMIILPTPIYSDYSFMGWYTSDGIKVGGAGGSYMADNTIPLYAQWTPKEWYEEFLRYSYERGYSKYYVTYEMQYYANDFLFNKILAEAYFDSYATAWAFSQTGGPNPTPYYEEMWTNGVNKWWVEYERGNYLVKVEDLGDKTIKVYYGPLLPGTYEAPPTWSFSGEGHTNHIEGVQGPATFSETWLLEDPGYFGGDEPIRVYEYWWITTYSGWIYGEPDVYTILMVPTDGIIYSCQ